METIDEDVDVAPWGGGGLGQACRNGRQHGIDVGSPLSCGKQQVFLCLSVGGCVMVMGEITLEQTNPRTSRRREGE